MNSRLFPLFLKLFVRTFYREYAAAFIFLLTIMFGAVGQMKGAGIVEYHEALIIGMLGNGCFFSLVLLIWSLYTFKCFNFCVAVFQQPSYNFLSVFTQRKLSFVFPLFLGVQFLLLLPILPYAVLIIILSFSLGWWMSGAIIILFLTALLLISALLLARLLYNREINYWKRPQLKWLDNFNSRYPILLTHYILRYHPLLFMGIKIYTCGILYLMATSNVPGDYDPQFPLIFFCFGIFGHAMIIYRMRQFEEEHLSAYRGLPVSILKRFIGYIYLYLVILLPELATLFILMPVHLQLVDAAHYALTAISFLLLLNGISFTGYYSMKSFLKISSLFFGAVLFFIAMRAYYLPYLLFFPVGCIMFSRGYYRYQHEQ